MTEELRFAIGLVGALSQFGSIALIVVLMLSLLSTQREKPQFVRWSGAWIAFLIGIGAIVIRYSAFEFGGTRMSLRPEGDPLVRALYFTYFSGKFAYLALIVLGVRAFAGRDGWRLSSRAIVAGCVLLGGGLALASPTLNYAMVVQSAAAAPAFGLAAWALASHYRRKRALGTAILASACGAHAILWLLYACAFGQSLLGLTHWPLLASLLVYNSFVDAVLQTLLAYGIVVVSMEATAHDAREAHANLEAAHDALRRAALYDPHTGALNRRAFTEGVGLGGVNDGMGVVVVVDVDHLKPINDSFGHAAGDALLRHVADTLGSSLRAADALYRWGGDEFLMIVARSSENEARMLLSTALERAPVLRVGGTTVPVRVSFGLAPFASRDAIPDAIAQADRAMYAAKTSRRSARQAPFHLVALGAGNTESDNGAL